MDCQYKTLVAVTDGDVGGGARQVVSALIGGLTRHGVEPVLVVGNAGTLVGECRRLGHKAFVIPELRRSINPALDYVAYRKFLRIVHSERPHLLHGHSFKAGAIARLVSRSTGVPAVYTVHGWGAYYALPRPIRPAGLALESYLSAREAVTYVCRADSEIGETVGMTGRVIPVASAPRGEQRDAPLMVEPGTPVRILIVARFTAQKDPIGTVRTLAALHDARSGLAWSVTWVGDGPLKQKTIAEAKRLRLYDRVHWLDSTDDVGPLYQRAHVFLLLSRYEGTPLSIAEAMRARLITIATAVGGVPEMLESAGILIPPDATISQRVDLILQVLSNPGHYSSMRDRAGVAACRYDSRRMVGAYAALYGELTQTFSSGTKGAL